MFTDTTLKELTIYKVVSDKEKQVNLKHSK